jgi:metal iron transporter
MPHSLFLGSALATQDRISPKPPKAKTKKVIGLVDDSKNSSETEFFEPQTRGQRVMRTIKEFVCSPFRVPQASEYSTRATRHADRENKPLAFVKAHIYHGIVDVVASLLGFAVLINSLFVPRDCLSRSTTNFID